MLLGAPSAVCHVPRSRAGSVAEGAARSQPHWPRPQRRERHRGWPFWPPPCPSSAQRQQSSVASDWPTHDDRSQRFAERRPGGVTATAAAPTPPRLLSQPSPSPPLPLRSSDWHRHSSNCVRDRGHMNEALAARQWPSQISGHCRCQSVSAAEPLSGHSNEGRRNSQSATDRHRGR
jgi:hypothetical protein